MSSVVSKSLDEDRVGAVTSMADNLVDRIKSEFGTQDEFFSSSSIGGQKFVFVSAGTEAILTMVAGDIDDSKLRVYGDHVARKITQVLSGASNLSLDLPKFLEIISQFTGGKIPKGTYSTKIIVCGDYMVGKTSLIRRFVEGKFQDDYLSTLGVDITKKTIDLASETTVNFIIWDIAGQSNMLQMAPQRKRFYNGANAALLVFDKTRHSTLESTAKWLKDIKDSVPDNIPIVLVGNKSDLVEKYEVTIQQALTKASDLGDFHLIETSAKTGENVEDAFRYLGYKIVAK